VQAYHDIKSQHRVNFLGLEVSPEGICPAADKIDFLNDAKGRPSNVSELRSLIGSITFYSRFISRFSEIMKPLNEKLRKDSDLNWSEEQESSLREIREILRTCKAQRVLPREAPKLVELHLLPDSIDVSCTSSQGQLLERASRRLAEAERNYTKVELNLVAMLLAYAKFGPMLSDTNTGWAKKNRYGHFHSYLTTALEFFDTLNMKIITNKFSTNFEKMAVRRGPSEFLHGLKVDAIFKWINRV